MNATQAVEQFDWESVPLETVSPGMRRRIVTGELMTVARIWFDDGFVVPKHSHHNEQITQVVSGILRFRFGEDGADVRDIGPGGIVVIPAHLPHAAESVGAVEEIDIWAPRRDDWLDGSDDYLRR